MLRNYANFECKEKCRIIVDKKEGTKTLPL